LISAKSVFQILRKAKGNENKTLTDISFAAKRYWDYPDEYFDVWQDELTVSEAYIEDNVVFVVENESVSIAYYSIIEVEEDFFAGETKVEKGVWLEHMFVLPQYIGKGIGKAMYAHMQQQCRDNGVVEIRIFSDPNAKGFYERMGARYLGERPSGIEGRSVSVYAEKL